MYNSMSREWKDVWEGILVYEIWEWWDWFLVLLWKWF